MGPSLLGEDNYIHHRPQCLDVVRLYICLFLYRERSDRKRLISMIHRYQRSNVKVAAGPLGCASDRHLASYLLHGSVFITRRLQNLYRVKNTWLAVIKRGLRSTSGRHGAWLNERWKRTKTDREADKHTDEQPDYRPGY